MTAQTNYNYAGDYRYILRAEHIHILLYHYGHALRGYCSEKVYLQTAYYCKRNPIYTLNQRSKEGHNHSQNGRYKQYGYRKDLSNSHSADIFAVVCTCRAAHKARNHIADTVSYQV